jgi:hypothetical protein
MNKRLLRNTLIGGLIAGFGLSASLSNTLAVHSILSVYLTTAIMIVWLLEFDFTSDAPRR